MGTLVYATQELGTTSAVVFGSVTTGNIISTGTITTTGITNSGNTVNTGTNKKFTFPSATTYVFEDVEQWQGFRMTGGTGGYVQLETYDGHIRMNDTQDGRVFFEYDAGATSLEISPTGYIKIGSGGGGFGGGYFQIQTNIATLYRADLNLDGLGGVGGKLQIDGTTVLDSQMPYDAAPTATTLRDALIQCKLMAAS